MKIAIIVPDDRDEFKRHEITSPYFGSAPTNLLNGFASLPQCEVHVICALHQPLSAPERLAENIFYHSTVVPKLGWRSLYAGCIWSIRAKLREIKPDVVHGQGTERYCALSAVASGYPNLVTIHGNMRAVARKLKARPFSILAMTARLEAFALRRTGGVLCLTRYTLEQVGDLARRTWMVPNATDPDYFGVARIPTLPPTLLCLANLSPYKNQIALIEALEPLARERQFQLVFGGRCPDGNIYATRFLEMVRSLPWCRYAGSLDRQAMRQLMSESTLLVHPSLEDNCPMVILEAMAAGVPVAASRIGGIPDLVTPGKTGRLFDPTNPHEIRNTLREMLDDPASLSRFGKCARTTALEQFAPEMIARRHLQTYRELLEIST